MKAVCRGWSSPEALARPSIVVTVAPSISTAGKRQELTAFPFTSTVQAPHSPLPQPYLVPVISSSSLSSSRSVQKGSTSISILFPFNAKAISFFIGTPPIVLFPWRGVPCAGQGLPPFPCDTKPLRVCCLWLCTPRPQPCLPCGGFPP